MRKNELQLRLATLAAAFAASPIRPQGTIGGKPVADHLDAVLAQMSESAGDEASLKAAVDLIGAANQGADNAIRALNALRIETTSNLVIPELRIIPSFFNVVQLADNERPVWQNETRHEVTVRQVSSDGRRAIGSRLVKAQTEALIDLKEIATDPIQYPLRDTYLGNVQPVNSARANIDIARDLAASLDSLGLALLDTCFGSWSLTSGARQDRVIVPHSYIKSANLPTSNDITLDADTLTAMGITRSSRVVNSTTTGLRQEVFDALTWYVSAWGEVKPAGSAVEPTGVLLVPSKDVSTIGNSLTLDGAKGSDIAEAIKKDGFARVPWMSRTWTLVPSATLAPNTLLVPFSQKIGVLYLKPSMDWEQSKVDIAKNFEERTAGKVYGLYSPSHYKPFALRIRYRTNA
jgi:hypothetical protein